MRKPFSTEIENNVKELYISGHSVREISSKLGVSTGYVSKTIDNFSAKIEKSDISALHDFYGIIKKLNLNAKDALSGFSVYSSISKNDLTVDFANNFTKTVLVLAKQNNLSPDKLLHTCERIIQVQSKSRINLEDIEGYHNELIKKIKDLEAKKDKSIKQYNETKNTLSETLNEYNVTQKQLANTDGLLQFLKKKGANPYDLELLYNMIQNAEKNNYDVNEIVNHITQYKELEQALVQKQKEYDKIISNINKVKKDYQELSLRYENISLRHKSLKDSISVIESLEKSGIKPDRIVSWGKIFDSFGVYAEEFEKQLRNFGSKEKLYSLLESKISTLERKITSLEKRKAWLEENINNLKLEISNGTEYSKKNLENVSKQTKENMKDIFDNYFNDVESFKLKCINEIVKTHNETKTYFDQQKSLFEKFIEDIAKTSKETQKLELVKPIYDMLQGKAKLADSLSLMIILLDRLDIMMKSQVKDWHAELQVTEFRKFLVGLLSKK